jgi:hypothetical protein
VIGTVKVAAAGAAKAQDASRNDRAIDRRRGKTIPPGKNPDPSLNYTWGEAGFVYRFTNQLGTWLIKLAD